MSTGRGQAAARLVAILRDSHRVAYRPSLLKEVARGVQQSPPPSATDRPYASSSAGNANLQSITHIRRSQPGTKQA